MRALIRVDASELIGSGHVMRCLTLAHALVQFDFEVDFICRVQSGNLNALIMEQGFHILGLPEIENTDHLSALQAWLPCSEEQDASDCLALISHQYDLLVVDHYGLGKVFSTVLRHCISKIAVIDDLANRTHECDLLLDQNSLFDYQSRYDNLVREGTLLLLGGDYVLLRDEFVGDIEAFISTERERVLIYFGGADTRGLTLTSLEALADWKRSSIGIDLVIGANHQDRQEIESICASMQQVILHVQCHYMAKLMSKARLMIGAGGATNWERCAMGLPSLVVLQAENQFATSHYLDEKGACVILGDAVLMTKKDILNGLSLFNDNDRLDKMSRAAKSIISTKSGAKEVAARLYDMCITAKII